MRGSYRAQPDRACAVGNVQPRRLRALTPPRRRSQSVPTHGKGQSLDWLLAWPSLSDSTHAPCPLLGLQITALRERSRRAADWHLVRDCRREDSGATVRPLAAASMIRRAGRAPAQGRACASRHAARALQWPLLLRHVEQHRGQRIARGGDVERLADCGGDAAVRPRSARPLLLVLSGTDAEAVPGLPQPQGEQHPRPRGRRPPPRLRASTTVALRSVSRNSQSLPDPIAPVEAISDPSKAAVRGSVSPVALSCRLLRSAPLGLRL